MSDRSPSRGSKLPPVPPLQAGDAVACWREPMVMPTYRPLPPSVYPAFLENRVYQGSSGAVYPLPFYEAVSDRAEPVSWDAVHLENQWVRLVVLPELGGRIHAGYDKVRDHDFFYHSEVIKPALVGLAGPWLSGGVEFNWPQHHRPATFLPTVAEVEHGSDGSVTVWCSDHDPMQRMKGTHGIRLYPDRAVVEVLVRLTNRTELPQTFLWWANVAAEVHDGYQSFFPPDVHFVADHANRATVAFPRADGPYYGIDYPSRVDEAHPDADRLDWYRNIPVPTSYMVLDSAHEFFGGYDHHANAGFVHWASRDVSPGKKQWTWGTAPFGRAWDHNLSDDGRPYVELMAGVYTNNQPDFTFLAPGETKTFSQLWYPIGDLGPVQEANQRAAAHLSVVGGDVQVGLGVSSPVSDVAITLTDAGKELAHWTLNELVPESPWVTVHPWQGEHSRLELVASAAGEPLVAAALVEEPSDFIVPPPSQEPEPAERIASSDELYLIGVHLDQYRHATRSPEPYWLEALRRDPGDLRCNAAMGLRHYRRGDYIAAQQHLRAAVGRSNMLNQNPRDGEPHYLLGLVLARQGADDEALRWLARAGWDGHWAGAAALSSARICLRRGADEDGLRHAVDAAGQLPRSGSAQAVLATALRRAGRHDEAREVLTEFLSQDPMDMWVHHSSGQRLDSLDAGMLLDVGRDHLSVGNWTEALDVLEQALSVGHIEGQTAVTPLVHYHRARALAELGQLEESEQARNQAMHCDARWALAVTLDDVDVLTWAVDHTPDDPVAHALLGSWCYHHGRHQVARDHWQQSERTRPDDVVLRNLGLDAYNHLHDADLAERYYSQAAELARTDAKLLSEADQLAQRRRLDPQLRLRRLQASAGVVAQRDDLCVSLARLLVLTDQAKQAKELLESRHFQPWEGGEGQTLAAWDAACLCLAAHADPESAIDLAGQTLHPPACLGEARHPLANTAHIHLLLGDALARSGDSAAAEAAWLRAAGSTGDFQDMAVTQYSDVSWFSIMAARRLGEHEQAQQMTDGLSQFIDHLKASEPRIDYFATSLPSMLLFTDDLGVDRDDQVAVLRAQLALLEGQVDAPAVAAALARVPHHLGLHLIRHAELWRP